MRLFRTEDQIFLYTHPHEASDRIRDRDGRVICSEKGEVCIAYDFVPRSSTFFGKETQYDWIFTILSTGAIGWLSVDGSPFLNAEAYELTTELKE